MTPSFLATVTLYMSKQLRTEGKRKLEEKTKKSYLCMLALNFMVDILVEISGQ